MIALEMFLNFIEYIFCDNWLMFAGIPVATLFWILEHPVVKWVLKDNIYVAECNILIPSTFEVDLEFQPVVEFPATPLFVGHLFKHFLDYRRSLRINNRVAFPVGSLLVQISSRSNPRSQTHLTAHTESTPHVYSSIIILKLRLRAEDHQ